MNLNPIELLRFVAEDNQKEQVFIAGGPVRDWLLEKAVKDVDLVFSHGAITAAKNLASAFGGAFVMLDEAFQVARVVVQDISYDFSQYRGDATTIKEDLAHRDFTINAMAVPLDKALEHLSIKENAGLYCSRDFVASALVDPFNGKGDLEEGLIRAISRKNLEADPLRMLRAFRFRAVLHFSIEPQTLSWISDMASYILKSAPERIDLELDKIMASPLSGITLRELFGCSLLRAIIPETAEMEGVEQPGFHHLDVLGHLFEAVSSMDKLVEDPCIKFRDCEPFRQWLKANSQRVPWLKWAAFMHDFGKPARKGQKENGRVTFYEHDKEGAQMARDVAKRLRWSKEKQRFVSLLIRLHMRPFHLLNDLRKSGPSKRAMRRLLDEIGPDYPALFLLAMSDSMAGCGPMKPKELDDEIGLLFRKIHNFYLKSLKPVEENPPLLRGQDVMKALQVGPGPIVGKALRAVREAQVEGTVSTREEAIDFIRRQFKKD